MARRIIVSGNCQIGGISAALAGMLPDDEVEPVPHIPGDPGSEARHRDAVAGADVWVTNVSPTVQRTVGDAAPSAPSPLYLPDVRFFGFHPDIAHVQFRDGGILQTGAAGPYNSTIVLAGWRLGLSEDEILARFDDATGHALGHDRSWATHLVELKRRVDLSDLDWAEVYLPLARGTAFMLTDNHPRVDALIHLARLAAGRLGADPERVAFPWEQVVPDGLLATSEVWPVYPVVAAPLGLDGGFVWRTGSGQLLGLEEFVRRSLETYRIVDPDSLDAPELDDPRLVAALRGRRPAGASA